MQDNTPIMNAPPPMYPHSYAAHTSPNFIAEQPLNGSHWFQTDADYAYDDGDGDWR